MAGEKMDYDNVEILYRWTLLDLYSFLNGVFFAACFRWCSGCFAGKHPEWCVWG